MINYSFFAVLLVYTLLPFFGNTQSTSKIKKLNILESEEIVYDSLNKKTLLSKKQFDGNGNVLYEEEYNKKGQLKLKVKREFDKKNQLTKESYFNQKDQLIEENTYSYSFENVVQSTHKLIENGKETQFTVVYSYNGFNEKTEEIKKDNKGNILETVSYEYDKQGLKTKKIRKNAQGQVIETKEYSYQFAK